MDLFARLGPKRWPIGWPTPQKKTFGVRTFSIWDLFRHISSLPTKSMMILPYHSTPWTATLSTVKTPHLNIAGWRNQENEVEILLMEEILHQLIWEISPYLQCFIHPRWCRISAINSTITLESSLIFHEPILIEVVQVVISCTHGNTCRTPSISSLHFCWRFGGCVVHVQQPPKKKQHDNRKSTSWILYFLLNMRIFQCHVSLQECIISGHPKGVLSESSCRTAISHYRFPYLILLIARQ